jgi:hypothetical protein
LAGKVYPRDIEDPFERDIAALPVNFQLSREQAATNTNVYSYSIEVPTTQPSFEQYDACASRLLGGFTNLAWDYVSVALGSTLSKLLEIFKEGRENGTEGIGLSLLNNIVSEMGTSDALAFLSESLSESAGLEPSDYINSDIFIIKKPLSQTFGNSLETLFSPSLVYSQAGLDVLSPSVLPSLIAGPAPPRLDEIRPIVAFKGEATGAFALIDEEDGFVVEPGATVAFRAFDQFFNQARASTLDNKIETQRYDCADYRWTVKRDGQPYLSFTGYRQPEGDPGVLLEDLPAGNYTVGVRVNNNGLAGGFTMNANWTPKPTDLSAANTDFQDLPLQPLPVDTETLTSPLVFTVADCRAGIDTDRYLYIISCYDESGELIRSERLEPTPLQRGTEFGLRLIVEIHTENFPSYSPLGLSWIIEDGSAPWMEILSTFSPPATAEMALLNKTFLNSGSWRRDSIYPTAESSYRETDRGTPNSFPYTSTNTSCRWVINLGTPTPIRARETRYYASPLSTGAVTVAEVEISEEECPTLDDVKAVNSWEIEDSYIYQCLTSGEGPENCKLAPVL